MVHIYAGNLLMTTGSYEDATKAFTNADNIHKSPLALYQRSRCHVALNNMNEALKDLNKVIEASPNDKVAIADRECLTSLRIAQVGFGGGVPGNPVGAPTATLASVPSQIGNV
jgi:tetratricopeptide (TPR) repeat protein